MTEAHPNTAPAWLPSKLPAWPTWVDGGVIVALTSAGLLAPDHRDLWYAALLVAFAGIAGPVLAGAAISTWWSERRPPEQRLQGARRRPALMAREARDTALAAWVAACLVAWALWRSWTGRPIGLVWSAAEAGGVLPALLQSLAGVVVLDAWLYWKHRLLHSRWLFAFHRGHHVFRDPTAFAGFAVGPVESLLTFWPVVLVAVPQAKHWAPIYFALVGGFILLNFYLHCGVAVRLLEALLPRLLVNTSAFHNRHHANADVNFGEALTLWDRLCRTRLEDRVKVKDQAHK